MIDQITAFRSIEILSTLSKVPQINTLISTATDTEYWLSSCWDITWLLIPCRKFWRCHHHQCTQQWKSSAAEILLSFLSAWLYNTVVSTTWSRTSALRPTKAIFRFMEVRLSCGVLSSEGVVKNIPATVERQVELARTSQYDVVMSLTTCERHFHACHWDIELTSQAAR